MKRFLALVATAVAAVALYAATAPAGQQAVTPGQFNALKKQVTKLRSDLNAVTTVMVGCVMGTAVPITQYTGYVYQTSSGQDILTTALDLTEQGGTPQGYALLVNSDPTCVNLINSTSLRRLAASTPAFKRMPSTTFGHPQSRR